MAQDIVGGLFGPQPWQIQQARQDAIAQAADRFAAQSPFERAAGLGYRAGAGLGQMAGGMLGLEDPAVVEAQQRRAALEGLDITSPESILQRAQQIQDPQMRMRLMMMAQQQAAQQQEQALKRAQELAQLHKARAEASPLAKIDPSKYTRESIEAWVKDGMRNPSLLVSVEKQATPSEYAKMLVEAGYDPNSAEFKTEMQKYTQAKLTGTAKGAGTTLNLPKIELKTGESVAGQVGPIMKESRAQAQGAIQTFDSANRIEQALKTNNVIAGPLASASMLVRQVFDPKGKSPEVQETRKVIRALAESTVNARKALEGQGSITENEAAAAAKAASGDIDSMTVGELYILVNMNKRAAALQARSHVELLDAANANEATKGLTGFYSLKGLEPLLKYDPNPTSPVDKIPTTNTQVSIDERLKKYNK